MNLKPDPRPAALFFIPTLAAGGAERVCVQYLNDLKTFRPILMLQFRRGELLKELQAATPVLEINAYTGYGARSRTRRKRLHHAIRRRRRRLQVRFKHLRRKPQPRRRALRRQRTTGSVFFTQFRFVSDCLFLVRQARLLAKAADAKHCDIIVSFLPFTNVISILSKILFERQRKVVINVHSVKTDILQDAPSYDQRLLKSLIRRLYRKADCIIAVSDGIKQDLVRNFGIPENKIRVIHNPIDVKRICRLAEQEVDHPWINQKKGRLVVAVGRLVRIKGYDLLIRAFAQLPQQTDARLMIIGHGPELAPLQKLAQQLDIEQRIAFLGFQQNPWKFMKQADCLVLSSRTEGLPMVIGEALALELPVIAVDCSHGVREYLEDSRYGMIVPPNDAGALADGIRDLLENEELRINYAQRARDRVQIFARGRIVDIFESTLREVIET